MKQINRLINKIAIFEIMANAEELQDWAHILNDEAARNNTPMFGRKYFIGPLMEIAIQAGMTREGFVQKLFAANRSGLLRLSRADLVSAMPRDLVQSSNIKHPFAEAEFHFIEFPPFATS
jgi:hypothetical protein